MKTIKSTLIKAALSLLVCLSLQLVTTREAKAQLEDAGEILRSGAHDANLLMEGYLKPFGAGFGAGLNSGWFNTAGAYKPFGFDLRLNAAVSMVPSSDRLFNITQLGLQNIEVISGSAETPTISGEDISGPKMGSRAFIPGTNDRLFEFDMPQGIGIPYVPAPMAQLTLGIGMGSDLSIRYLPTIEVPDVANVGLFGFGVKHGLNQWLPGGSVLPFDLSVQFGYTKLSIDADFEVLPEIDEMTEVPFGMEAGSSHWNGQGIEFDAKGFTGNILIGKQLPVLSVYAGLGFQNSSMSIRSPGNYPIIETNLNDDGSINEQKPKRVDSISEPLDLKLDGANGLHALAGVRIRLAILTISGSYTLAKYPVANVGIGISIR